jgi:hypothetical protein
MREIIRDFPTPVEYDASYRSCCVPRYMIDCPKTRPTQGIHQDHVHGPQGARLALGGKHQRKALPSFISVRQENGSPDSATAFDAR